jgi:hypothetical protein
MRHGPMEGTQLESPPPLPGWITRSVSQSVTHSKLLEALEHLVTLGHHHRHGVGEEVLGSPRPHRLDGEDEVVLDLAELEVPTPLFGARKPPHLQIRASGVQVQASAVTS